MAQNPSGSPSVYVSKSLVAEDADSLNLFVNTTVQKILQQNKEQRVLFSAVVTKVNRKNKSQERTLMLTERALYNLEPKTLEVKRRIDALKIDSVLFTSLTENDEFVVKIPSEYDYMFSSDKKIDFLRALSMVNPQARSKQMEGADLRLLMKQKKEWKG